MKANEGDRMIIKGHRVGEPDRDAEILEVHGEDGAPAFPPGGPKTYTLA